MNAYLHGFGSGSELSIRVKRFATVEELPETARGNAIAVITAEPITGWQFSATQPEAEQGAVWFLTGDSGVLAIQCLKKNGITVYPMECRQYVEGSWVRVPAKVYIGGWQDMTGYRYLYREGDTCDAVGGKWIASAKAPESSVNYDQYLQAPAIQQGEKTMTVYMDASTNKGGIARKENKIDITGYSRLVCGGTFAKKSGIALHIWSAIGTYQSTNSVASKRSSDMGGQWYVDLTGVPNGEYYVGFSFWGVQTADKLAFDYIRME